jgi:starch phosphorylase
VEIRQQVGTDNFFLFGHTTEQIAELRRNYRPWEWVEKVPLLREALDLIERGHFSNGDGELFRPLVQNIVGGDPYFLLADLSDYLISQNDASRLWANPSAWQRASILNTARSGYFSSDRAIREYAERVWEVQPLPVAMGCEVS